MANTLDEIDVTECIKLLNFLHSSLKVACTTSVFQYQLQ